MGVTGSKQVEMIKEGESVVDFLKKNAFFRDIKDLSQLKRAAGVFEVIRITQNPNESRRIISKGDIGDCLYIVARGQVEVAAPDELGNRTVLRKLIRQDVFTEIGFIHNVPSTVDMDAVKEKVVMLKLTKQMYTKHKTAKYMKHLVEWLDATAANMVSSSLKNVSMLADVPDDKLATVARLFELKVYQKGERIFAEGDGGDAFYILTKGRLIVTAMQNGEIVELSRLKPGQSFGELSLVDDQTRTATVTCLEESNTLFKLSREQFKVFLELIPSMAEKIRKNINERSAVSVVAKKIPFFQTLEPNKLHLLGTMSKIQSYRAGATIMMEGRNKPAKFFMITQGTVEVTVKDMVVRTMQQGEYFGEISLVSGRDATATVKASTEVVCLEVSREEFESLFANEAGALAEIQIRVLGATVELRHILVHPFGKRYFKEFSQEQFAGENIDFWLEADELERAGQHKLRRSVAGILYGVGLEKAEEQKRTALRNRVDRIYDAFIKDSAENQVNIKGNVRETITNRIEEDNVDYEIFRPAKNEVYELMSLDVFSRFKTSAAFKRMLDEIGVYGVVDGDNLKGITNRLDRRAKSVEGKNN
ncbi:hypothetical protein BASA81_000656 [Batrachochytrium salamandrivorans]|nr:hypothetical protein BASA81_000656 [Batrachochytrium salamandrivorans]